LPLGDSTCPESRTKTALFEGLGALPDYRLYFFEDGLDGPHIRTRDEFACADDEAAIEQALGLADGRMMELWRDAVYLKGWPAKRRP
jgi:hypothetical protein